MKVLIIGDMHLSVKKPVGRIENDWLDVIVDKISQIEDIYIKNKCEKTLCLGDVFHNSQEFLIESYFRRLKCFFEKINLYSIVGNHDSKAVDSNVDKTSFGMFPIKIDWEMDNLPIKGYSYANRDKFFTDRNPEIIATHDYIALDAVSFPFPIRSIKEVQHLPKLALIGHNHSFNDFTYKGLRFYQPGAIIRRNRNDTFKPRVSILNTDNLEITSIDLKINPNVFTPVEKFLIKGSNVDGGKIDDLKSMGLNLEKFKIIVEKSNLSRFSKNYIVDNI